MDTADFDRALAARNLAGFWTARVPAHVPERPFLWKWVDVRDALLRASREIGIEAAERRVIKLANPHQASGAASRTIQFNFSIVNGGEHARAHRHTLGAVRFVVEGSGAWTNVNGERCDMAPGDLILTPAWTWHDHHNASAEPIIWLDGLDGPLVQALNAAFFENYPQAAQPTQLDNSPLRTPLAEALAALNAAVDDPFDGRVWRYAERAAGSATLPTMACELSRLVPGQRTRSHRHASAALYHVFEGRGRTRVGDEILEWSKGDTFALPLWSWHEHEGFGELPALLFSMNDAPAMRALGLYREETRDVTSGGAQ
jgi:gentisate 1,2-dioxygenase